MKPVSKELVNEAPDNKGEPVFGEKLGLVPTGGQAVAPIFIFTSAEYGNTEFPKPEVSNQDCTLEVAQPVGEVAETAYLKLVVTPARILFWKTNF